MQITTKFNIWDTVWTIKDNKAYSFVINNIEIITSTQPQWHIYSHIYYHPNWDYEKSIWWHKEDKVVWSREELINLL